MMANADGVGLVAAVDSAFLASRAGLPKSFAIGVKAESNAERVLMGDSCGSGLRMGEFNLKC